MKKPRSKNEVFWPAQRDFVPCCRTIASLRSLPRRQKCSPGAFSSESLTAFSLLVRIPLYSYPFKKNNGTTRCRVFLARPEGFEPPFFRIGICCVIQLRHERLFSFSKTKWRQKAALFSYSASALSSQILPMSIAL